jgi:hypothetical protein
MFFWYDAVEKKQFKQTALLEYQTVHACVQGGKQTRAAAAAMASLQNRRKFSEREQGILEGHKEEGGGE